MTVKLTILSKVPAMWSSPSSRLWSEAQNISLLPIKHKQKDSDPRFSLEIVQVFGYLNLLGFGNFSIHVLKVIILFFLDDL